MERKIIERIKNEANDLGITYGSVVLMHSSLKSLGCKAVTPRLLLTALAELIGVFDGSGNGGTLVLPALSYEHCNRNNTVFDYHTTPSNVGVIPEYFRTKFPEVIRSLCPTHSCCAVGGDAAFITASHHKDNTPCGENSPFRLVKDLGGMVLFLGCGTKPNTSMHGVEELINPDYLWNGEYDYTLIDRGGKEIKMTCKAHGFKNTIQRYDKIEALLDKNEINRGKIFDADCVLMDARALWRKGEAMLREDQHYFVDFC